MNALVTLNRTKASISLFRVGKRAIRTSILFLSFVFSVVIDIIEMTNLIRGVDIHLSLLCCTDNLSCK
jgi:hypothetical protein